MSDTHASRSGGPGQETPSSVRVAVGLGSNRGRRARHLAAGRELLERVLTDLRCSRVYRTEPVGASSGQRAFLNMCCTGGTSLPARELLDRFQAAERRAGREPGARDGPRTLDLDLLLYGGRTITRPGLEVPHPRMARRAFVLTPLAELVPGAEVPGAGGTVEELARRAGTGGIEPLGALEELLEGDDGC